MWFGCIRVKLARFWLLKKKKGLCLILLSRVAATTLLRSLNIQEYINLLTAIN